MKRFGWTLAIVLAVMPGAVPIAAAQNRTLGETVDDVTLTVTVKTKLVADRANNLLKVDVNANRGVIYLKGTVATDDDRIEAERLARRTAGVRDVVNELKVEGLKGETVGASPSASPRTR